jgi:hypothetical protein
MQASSATSTRCQTQILTDHFTTFVATCLSSLAVESRPEREPFSVAVRPSLNRLRHSLVCVRLMDSLLHTCLRISNVSENIFPNLKFDTLFVKTGHFYTTQNSPYAPNTCWL